MIDLLYLGAAVCFLIFLAALRLHPLRSRKASFTSSCFSSLLLSTTTSLSEDLFQSNLVSVAPGRPVTQNQHVRHIASQPTTRCSGSGSHESPDHITHEQRPRPVAAPVSHAVLARPSARDQHGANARHHVGTYDHHVELWPARRPARAAHEVTHGSPREARGDAQ